MANTGELKGRSGIVNAQVLFIGGVAACGKSTVAAELGREQDLLVIELDQAFNQLEEQKLKFEVAVETVCRYGHDLLTALHAGGGRAIVVGWVMPEQVKDLSARDGFLAVFCGYPDLAPKQRLLELYAAKTSGRPGHWLTDRPYPEALRILGSLAKKSHGIRDDCRQFGMPFVDCTDIGAAQTVVRQLFRTHFA